MSFDSTAASVHSTSVSGSASAAARREDELAIRDLAYRYARMVDRRDWAEIPRVFTPACELSGQGYLMRGHAELDQGLRKIDMFSATQHCVHNQVTRIDGDAASGEFYCVANHIHVRDGVEYKLDMGIRYEDRYVRTDEGWRLAQRVLNLIWQQDLPLDFALSALTSAAGASRKTGSSRTKARPATRAKSRPSARAKARSAEPSQGRTKSRSKTTDEARSRARSKTRAKSGARRKLRR